MKNEDAGITSERRRLLLALVAIGAAFGVLSWLTWYYSDNYPMAFCFQMDGVNLQRPVRGIADVVQSQYFHYLTQHGRIVTEGLVQYLISFRERHLFDIFNTLMFVSFVYLILLHARQRCWSAAVIVTALLLALMRAFGEVFLWLSGSVNYLWVGCLTLAILHVFQQHLTASQQEKGWLYAVPAFLVGSMQEAFSIGVSAAFVVILAIQWRKHQRPSTTALAIAIGYMLGMLFCVCSPGNWQRAQDNVFNGHYNIGYSVLHVLLGLRIFWLLVVVVVVQLLNGRLKIRHLLHGNVLMLSAIIFQLLFLMLIGRGAEARGLFAVELFSLIVLLRLMDVRARTTTFAALAVSLLIYLPVLHATWCNHRATQAFLHELEGSEGLVFFDAPDYADWQWHYLGSKLIIDHRCHLFHAEAAFYGKGDGIMVLPSRLLDELFLTSSLISPQNEVAPGEYSRDDLAFTVIPLPKGQPPHTLEHSTEYVSFPSGDYLLKDKGDGQRWRVRSKHE